MRRYHAVICDCGASPPLRCCSSILGQTGGAESGPETQTPQGFAGIWGGRIHTWGPSNTCSCDICHCGPGPGPSVTIVTWVCGVRVGNTHRTRVPIVAHASGPLHPACMHVRVFVVHVFSLSLWESVGWGRRPGSRSTHGHVDNPSVNVMTRACPAICFSDTPW